MANLRSESMTEKRFRSMVAKALFPLGIRFRKNVRHLPGSPDIVFHKHRIVVFFDGDFWHGKHLDRMRAKGSPVKWIRKIENNIARDKRQENELLRDGWTILRIWESDFKKYPKREVVRVTCLFITE